MKFFSLLQLGAEDFLRHFFSTEFLQLRKCHWLFVPVVTWGHLLAFCVGSWPVGRGKAGSWLCEVIQVGKEGSRRCLVVVEWVIVKKHSKGDHWGAIAHQVRELG